MTSLIESRLEAVERELAELKKASGHRQITAGDSSEGRGDEFTLRISGEWDLATTLNLVEETMIRRALRRANNVRSEAAGILGLAPTELLKGMAKYGLYEKSLKQYSDESIELIRGGMTLKDVERECIVATLADNAGNRTKTAQVLGITRRTLQHKLQEYGLADFLVDGR
jgi:DNA-binding NtrC family response regulator